MQADEVVRRFWESVWTAGNAGELHDLLDPAFVENGEPVDVDGFVQAITSWRTIFPDFSATVEELLQVAPGRVVSRVTYRGTQQRPWAGLPATGRSFDGVGVDLFTVVDGRITELWHAADHLDMVMQLGGQIVPAEPLD